MGIVILSSAAMPRLAAPVVLSDVPVFSASSVPANLMLTLSVEFPTGTVAAYTDSNGYNKNNTYLGYFDPAKCYTYSVTDTYFSPAGFTASGNCTATQFNGNFLNWASMTALDEFRQTLSGGNRVFDTTSLTVLERSRQTAQGSAGNFPTKSTSASGQVPTAIAAAAGSVWARSRNGGTEFTSGTDRGVFIQFANNNSFSTAAPNTMVQYYARVKVCDAGIGLETNCAAYGTNYKPEGLIQQNAARIRVGAAGYLNRSGQDAPNGVIRSAVRDVGPLKYNGLAATTVNPFAEWSGTTGIFTANPDPTSATASAVNNSGAINYLNKFGLNQVYMTYDTISELYWSSLAYFKQVPLDASYTNGLAANPSWKDDFPVIQNDTNDPIAYSCQGNSIMVIGDSHTHYDSRVPGSTLTSGGNHPPLPVAFGVNASASADTLGAFPLLETNSGNTYSPTAQVYLPNPRRTNLGSNIVPSGATQATYYIAGLAYYAHVKDIRPDIAAQINTKGKQTIDTFVVDVLEPGRADNTAGNKTFDPNNLGSNGPNQYWLAAKYGGFDDVNDDGVPANYLSWHTNTSNNLDTRPDNLFPGNRPDLIRSGLAQIFNRVSSKKILSAVGPGTSTTRSLLPVNTSLYNTTAVGFSIYTTKYKPGDWTGDVVASIAAINPDGTISPVTTVGPPPVVISQWSAQARLDAMTQILDAVPKPVGWDTTRRVITRNGAAGVPFRWANISAAQKTSLRSDPDLLNFLRGDRSQEGVKFRSRRSVLGAVVNSEAVLVQGAQSPSYSDSFNPGYSAFRTAKATRAPMIYVGANDGMLHAFKGDFAAASPAGAPNGGGSELFAYVPSFLFDGPSSPATPDVNGLAAISNLTGITATPYSYRFYVDQTPQVSDADFNRVAGNADGSMGTPAWRTLLVGSAGRGGKGVYALDITDVPAALIAGASATNENLIKNKVLWEFAPADMGYLYGKPIIAKTRKYGWVVLVTSGYNNSTGLGKLFVLNAANGTLLETLSTGVGSAATPSGLGRAAAYTKNFSDNTIEQVYAGDLLGNAWRFDLSAATGTYPAPVKLATLISGGQPQPITTAPRVETDIDLTGLGTRRWVFFGTGQFLNLNDLTSAQTQSMYAFRDGTAALPGCEIGATTTPGVCTATGHDLPLVRSNLLQITDALVGVPVTDADAGWYFDLPGLAGSSVGTASERVIVDLDTQAGVPIVAWATLVPTDDPCQYYGAIYALNYASGKTALLSSGGVPIASVTPPGGAPTKVGIQQLPDGSLGLLFGALDGGANVQNLNAAGLTSVLSRTNWREILN